MSAFILLMIVAFILRLIAAALKPEECSCHTQILEEHSCHTQIWLIDISSETNHSKCLFMGVQHEASFARPRRYLSDDFSFRSKSR